VFYCYWEPTRLSHVAQTCLHGRAYCRTYPVVFPHLECQVCDRQLVHGTPRIAVTDTQYYDCLSGGTLWWTADITLTFGILKSHEVHREDTILVDAGTPTPKDRIRPNRYLQPILPTSVKRILTVANRDNHFVVLLIKLDPDCTTVVFNGLSSQETDLRKWEHHQDYILSRYGIVKDTTERKWRIRHYKPHIDFGHHLDITQKNDDCNCGPIACRVIWELLCPGEMDRKYPVENKRMLFSQGSRSRASTIISDWRWMCRLEMDMHERVDENEMWVEQKRKRPIGLLEGT